MTKILLIAAGGAAGASARYLLAGAVQRSAGEAFPVGTLLVNVVGCFLIGLLGTLFTGPAPLREDLRLAVMVGLLGGFTTYSAFALETLILLDRGQPGRAAAYVLLSNLLGLGACWTGWRTASLWAIAPASPA